MNFTIQRFLNPPICEYPTLEEDSSSIKERPEARTIIGVNRSLSAFQKAQDQEKWPRKLGVMINSPEPAKPTSSMESLQPIQLGSTQSYLWEPEDHLNQSGGGTSDRGSVQGVYLNKKKEFQHETNFIGFYTQDGVHPNWNRAKIFTEQEVMNFTNQKFPSPSICEYPTLEEDSSSVKERPEENPIIGVKRSLSAFQKVQDQEKWPRKLGVMINSPEPAKPTSSMESLQPIQLGSTQSYL
ncbi:hypothetical protein F2Q69_00038811 [Brassica cretica]|uniref:Uncharacterized protein n=1 Tax=Brassica cretica TaxID=69181 RepID=A0A8S9SPV4_BRACR|nr:hypothetical protein F2Q69_00038811 [Brassica cretica]